MPIYLYEREDGTTFEKIQKMADEPLSVCPETGQKVKRKLTTPAVHFKGSGFYQTDYKSSSSSSSGSGNSSSSSSDSSSKESSSGASCNGAGPAGGCGACSSSPETK